MGMWDEFCTICGGPTYVLFDDMDEGESEPLPRPAPDPADYTWLESFIGITSKEEVIHLAPYGGYGSFDIAQPDTSPYSYFAIGRNNEDVVDKEAARGYACHVTCYNLLQQELNYTLKHADVQPLLIDPNDGDYDYNSFSWCDYGGLAEYGGQSLGDVQLVKDRKLWMIEDPSRDAQNRERILKLWRRWWRAGSRDRKRGSGTTGEARRRLLKQTCT